jgi:hypothetical protein
MMVRGERLGTIKTGLVGERRDSRERDKELRETKSLMD